MKKILFIFAISAIVLGMASCGDGNDPSNLTSDVTFDIQVDETGPKHAKITYTPSDKNVWYFCMCQKKEELFPNGGDIKDIKTVLNKNWADMREALKEEGTTFEEYLNVMRVDPTQIAYKQGVYVRVENNLDPESEYIAFACLISNNGEVVGEVTYKTFTTDTGGASSDLSFDIQIDEVGTRHAKITFTPSDEDVWYFCMCEKTESLLLYCDDINDIKTALNWNLAALKQHMEEDEHISFEEYLNMMKVDDQQEAYKRGVFIKETNSLYPETEYVAYACLINNDAEVVGEVTWKTFTTDPDPE